MQEMLIYYHIMHTTLYLKLGKLYIILYCDCDLPIDNKYSGYKT